MYAVVSLPKYLIIQMHFIHGFFFITNTVSYKLSSTYGIKWINIICIIGGTLDTSRLSQRSKANFPFGVRSPSRRLPLDKGEILKNRRFLETRKFAEKMARQL